MRDISHVIDFLMNGRTSFSNKQLASALNVTRQRASQILKRLLKTGEVVRVSEGKRGRYARGLGAWQARQGLKRGGAPNTFWNTLLTGHQELAYVHVASALDGVSARTRQQAQSLLSGCGYRPLVIIDLEELETATDAFLDELLFQTPQDLGCYAQPINMCDAIARRYRVMRLAEQTSGSFPWTAGPQDPQPDPHDDYFRRLPPSDD